MTIVELVPGQRYTVTFEDCCVQGQFTDTFVELVPVVDGGPVDEPGQVERAVFEHASIGPGHGPLTFEPAE